MKTLSIVMLIMFLFTPPTNAYPKAQINECILGAKRSPNVLGVPETSIRNWCDCALRLTIDEGKDDIASANECGKKYFK